MQISSPHFCGILSSHRTGYPITFYCSIYAEEISCIALLKIRRANQRPNRSFSQSVLQQNFAKKPDYCSTLFFSSLKIEELTPRIRRFFFYEDFYILYDPLGRIKGSEATGISKTTKNFLKQLNTRPLDQKFSRHPYTFFIFDNDKKIVKKINHQLHVIKKLTITFFPDTPSQTIIIGKGYNLKHNRSRRLGLQKFFISAHFSLL